MARITHGDVVDAAPSIIKTPAGFRWSVGDAPTDMLGGWVRAVRDAAGAGYVTVEPDGCLAVTARGERLRGRVAA